MSLLLERSAFVDLGNWTKYFSSSRQLPRMTRMFLIRISESKVMSANATRRPAQESEMMRMSMPVIVAMPREYRWAFERSSRLFPCPLYRRLRQRSNGVSFGVVPIIVTILGVVTF